MSAIKTPAAKSADLVPLEERRRIGWRSMEVGLRDSTVGPQPSIMFGHFTRYNEWTTIESFWDGEFLERIAPGAFDEAFAEHWDSVRSGGRGTILPLFQHGRDASLGSKILGEIEVLESRDVGPYYEVGMFPGLRQESPLFIDGLARGKYGASFRFEVREETWNEKPKPSEHNPRGLPERTMSKLTVPEFGPVTFPAYPNATAGARSLSDWFSRAASPLRPLNGGLVGPGGPLGSVQDPRDSDPLLATKEARDRHLRVLGVIR